MPCKNISYIHMTSFPSSSRLETTHKQLFIFAHMEFCSGTKKYTCTLIRVTTFTMHQLTTLVNCTIFTIGSHILSIQSYHKNHNIKQKPFMNLKDHFKALKLQKHSAQNVFETIFSLKFFFPLYHVVQQFVKITRQSKVIAANLEATRGWCPQHKRVKIIKLLPSMLHL